MSKYIIKLGDFDFISKQGTYPDDTKDILDIKVFDNESQVKSFLDKLDIDLTEDDVNILSASDVVKLTEDGIEFDGEKEYPINSDPNWENKAMQILDYFDIDYSKEDL